MNKRGYATGGLLGALVSGVAVPALAQAAPVPTPAVRDAAPAMSAAWQGGAQVQAGKKIAVAGTVTKAAGAVRVDRLVGKKWVPAASVAVARAGRWSLAVTAPKAESAQTYRAVWFIANRPQASARLPVVDVYRLIAYTLGTKGRLASDPEAFAARAAVTYADTRGWRRAHLRFKRVRTGGNFVLMYAQAKTLPSFSKTCSAQYSCRVGKYVIVNETPWLKKTPYFTGDLSAYRDMVVNHETGHWLGFGHAYCAGKGRPAPVMQQQSKGMQGCAPNPWPLTTEVARVR